MPLPTPVGAGWAARRPSGLVGVSGAATRGASEAGGGTRGPCLRPVEDRSKRAFADVSGAGSGDLALGERLLPQGST